MAIYKGNDGRSWNDTAVSKTLAKDADAGTVVNVIADAKTITLPAAAAGLLFIVRNGGAPAGGTTGSGSNGSAIVTIAPNGTDTIGGAGRTSANTNLVNAKATSKVGDEVTLLGASGAWTIINQVGTWA